jgi:enoyl-CoA hydratase/carnithine racemase
MPMLRVRFTNGYATACPVHSRDRRNRPGSFTVGEFVTVTTDEDGVATLRLDRPPVNALNPQIWRELKEAAGALTDDDAVRSVVIWGGPKVFAAGADIKEFPEWGFQDVRDVGGTLHRSLDTLARIPVVTIAAITGYALGGGCELAMACDFRFIADNAKLGQPEILLGIIPGAGGTQRLPRLVGLAKAKELVFSGRMVDALEAERIGLADAIFPADDVYDRALAAAAQYAGGPYAIALAKQAIEDGTELPLDQALRLERSLFADCFATEDARIGIASFIEHGPGKAQFEGR